MKKACSKQPYYVAAARILLALCRYSLTHAGFAANGAADIELYWAKAHGSVPAASFPVCSPVTAFCSG